MGSGRRAKAGGVLADVDREIYASPVPKSLKRTSGELVLLLPEVVLNNQLWR
jgi:hypothetical protein